MYISSRERALFSSLSLSLSLPPSFDYTQIQNEIKKKLRSNPKKREKKNNSPSLDLFGSDNPPRIVFSHSSTARTIRTPLK
jgi:hypothetical protein